MTKNSQSEKVVHVGLDMSLSDLVAKLENYKDCEVLCVIPRGAALAYNSVNFTVLKDLERKQNLNLGIITSERDTAYIAKQAGLRIYRSLKKDPYSQIKTDPLYSIDHVVRFHDERPEKRNVKKYSIKELLGNRGQNKGVAALVDKFKSVIKKEETVVKNANSVVWNAPHRQAVLIMVGVSIVMLLGILYVALPSATIEIIPYASTTEQAVNIAVRHQNLNEETQGEKLTVNGEFLVADNVSIIVPYYTTGKIFEGENARGQIRVINKADRTWTFVPRTQFHTADGIVFRTLNYITVPANSDQGYGEAIVDVVADEFDTVGQPVGDRGNIGPTQFNIAKLPATSQELVYGVSDIAMSGGVTKTSTIVTKDDINAARGLGQKTLEEVAFEQLSLIAQQKQLPEDYRILRTPNSFVIENVRTEFDESVLGTASESFDVKVFGTIKGFALNETELFNLLTSELKKRQTPRKKIAEVDTSGITYRVIESEFEKGLLELTTTVKAIEVYDIGTQTLASTNLLNRIRENILGMRLEEASQYLENLPEVDRVRIDRWPFWAPTIPSIEENISFKIIDDLSD